MFDSSICVRPPAGICVLIVYRSSLRFPTSTSRSRLQAKLTPPFPLSLILNLPGLQSGMTVHYRMDDGVHTPTITSLLARMKESTQKIGQIYIPSHTLGTTINRFYLPSITDTNTSTPTPTLNPVPLFQTHRRMLSLFNASYVPSPSQIDVLSSMLSTLSGLWSLIVA